MSATMTEDVVLNLVFRCTSESNHSPVCRKIVFKAFSPPVTAGDVIRKIEEEIQIPAAAMTLEIHSVPLYRHTDELKWFKLRSGDTVTVHYYSVCDCREVEECVDLLKKILHELEKYVESSAQIQLELLRRSNFGICMFHNNCISKWVDPRSYANKINFIHKEGLQILSKILQCIAKIHTMSRQPSVNDYFLMSQLSPIEISLLDCLWDLTEDNYIREEVIKSGGIDTCLNILCVSTDHQDRTRIVKALGVIANLCEYTKARLQIGSRDDAINKIYEVLTRKSIPFTQLEVHRASMVILYLSYSPENHHHLINQELFTSILKVTPPHYDSYMSCLIRFNMAVFCSMLALLSPGLLIDKPVERHEMKCIMEVFVNQVDTKQLAEYEKDMGIYWCTIKPLLEAVYTCQYTVLCDDYDDIVQYSKRTIVITLQSLLLREYHRDILVKEEMVDYVLCLPWYTPEEVEAKRLGEVIIDASDVPYQPPSLLNICKAAVSVYHCGLHNVMRLSVPELANKLWQIT